MGPAKVVLIGFVVSLIVLSVAKLLAMFVPCPNSFTLLSGRKRKLRKCSFIMSRELHESHFPGVGGGGQQQDAYRKRTRTLSNSIQPSMVVVTRNVGLDSSSLSIYGEESGIGRSTQLTSVNVSTGTSINGDISRVEEDEEKSNNAAIVTFTSLALDVIIESSEDPLICLAVPSEAPRRNRTQSECVVRLTSEHNHNLKDSKTGSDQFKVLRKLQEALAQQDVYWNAEMDKISSLLRIATSAGGVSSLWDGMRSFLEEWLQKRQKSANRLSM